MDAKKFIDRINTEFILERITITSLDSFDKKCGHGIDDVQPLSKTSFKKLCDDTGQFVCNACDRLKHRLNHKHIEDPQLWMCMHCGKLACGRNDNAHAKDHFKNTSHSIAMDIHRFSFWCYKCDDDLKLSKNDASLDLVKVNLESLYKWFSARVPKTPQSSLQNNKLRMDNDNNKVTEQFPKVGGLTNLGNTCFFNSVLQCLAQTPFLVQALEDLQVSGQTFILPGGRYKGPDNEETNLPPIEGELINKEDSFAFTSVLKETLIAMQTSDGQVHRPSALLNALRDKTQECTDGGQHDSHELMRHLLECVRGEDVKRYQAIILKKLNSKEKTKNNTVDDNLKGQIKFYGNQANSKLLGAERVFRGELVSQLQCQVCGHVSICKEPFLDLSLPINVGQKATPPFPKRRITDFDNSMDNDPLKGIQGRRKHKDMKKANSKQQLEVSEEKKGTESGNESDADVEDNSENDDASNIGESGYSSEKPSSMFIEGENNLANCNRNNSSDLWRLPAVSSPSKELSQTPQENLENLHSPSSTDVQMIDLSENKPRAELDGMPRTDTQQPEEDNIVPVHMWSNSPLTVKENLTSSPSAPDVLEKFDEKINKKNNKLTNGVGDVASNLTKLDLSSCELDSPKRYKTKDGDLSVQVCLNQFTDLELMNNKNKVACVACTEREKKIKKETKVVCTDSTKQYLISREPAILILHLKRFQATRFSNRKIGVHVSFPLVLDLSPVCTKSSSRAKYALYGIVEHSGSIHGGHYVAYVKSRVPLKPDDHQWSFLPSKEGFESTDSSDNKSDSDDSSRSNDSSSSDDLSSSSATPSKIVPPPGQWYCISDSSVRAISEQSVLSKEAYLLFYERIL